MRLPGFAETAPTDVIRRAVRDFFADNLATYAAALSFHLLLALFPFVIFLLALLGAVGQAAVFDQLLGGARLALPPAADRLVEQVIGELRLQPHGGLLSLSIGFALWTASTGMRAVTTALNVAYGVPETRPIWQRYPLSLLSTIGLAALVLLSALARLLSPRTAQHLVTILGVGELAATVWLWLRWPVVVALLLLIIALIYDLGPNVAQPFRYVTPGSVIAVLVWIVASLGFSAYVDRFGDYGATYGSLGGMIVLLLYFFVSAAVLLFGAEINAVIHPAEALRHPVSPPVTAAPPPAASPPAGQS
jgi:membrane protein